MKKVLVLGAVFCALCFGLGAQQYYEGQGGRNLGGISMGEIKPTGLSNNEVENLLPTIQGILESNFSKYTGIEMRSKDAETASRYTLSGTIRRMGGEGTYELGFEIKVTDGFPNAGTKKAAFPRTPCSWSDFNIYQAAIDASSDLIAQMEVRLTQAGRDALQKQKEAWKEAWKKANPNKATTWKVQDNTFKDTDLPDRYFNNIKELALD